MKIICIGRNYKEHAKEFDNPVPEKPIFFLKPQSSLLLRNRPFFYPDYSNDIQYETELVIKIDKLGKNIQEKFANTYYNEIGIGIDFTARDLQRECKAKGLPWEISKAFDYSAPVSSFIPKSDFEDINNIDFHLNINSNLVQKGNSRNMIFSFDKIISYVSKFLTLKTGDLIFTGTPAGVGSVKINDLLDVFIEDRKMLSFRIK
ncbi:MAG: fumarylacetoacetate hydrolase family protein [Bacteroidales bacterium]|nr:fumarylacetoacetate hydrolase family protein [Bacteroidales bacterium]